MRARLKTVPVNVELARYREGGFRAAESRASGYLRRKGTPVTHKFGLQLVMARHKQGKTKDTKTLLQQAITDFQKQAPTLTSMGPEWPDWVSYQILRREAEKTLKE